MNGMISGSFRFFMPALDNGAVEIILIGKRGNHVDVITNRSVCWVQLLSGVSFLPAKKLDLGCYFLGTCSPVRIKPVSTTLKLCRHNDIFGYEPREGFLLRNTESVL